MEGYQSPVFSQDLNRFVMIDPIKVNDETIVPHLVQRDVTEDLQQVPTALTFGNMSVERVLAWDEKSNNV